MKTIIEFLQTKHISNSLGDITDLSNLFIKFISRANIHNYENEFDYRENSDGWYLKLTEKEYDNIQETFKTIIKNHLLNRNKYFVFPDKSNLTKYTDFLIKQQPVEKYDSPYIALVTHADGKYIVITDDIYTEIKHS